MGRRKRQQVGHSSDIAFLLIIFFLVMVGSTANWALMIDSTQNVPTSERSAKDETTLSELVHLEILLDGSVQVISTTTEQPLSIIEGKEVVLHTQEGVKWGQVVDILGKLTTWDVFSISFASVEEEL